MTKELLETDGENRAVRMFLALYGGACGVTTAQMRKHLEMAGFNGAWPAWANDNMHLTKAGAQLWIRHLFALAQPAQHLPFGVGGGLVAIKTLLSRDPCAHANVAIEMLDVLINQPAQEPFGYFKAEPFGWTDCAETDEGAIALYTSPHPANQVDDIDVVDIPAQPSKPDYAWPTVADYERDVGFQTNEAFRMAWNMARTTNTMLGIKENT